MLWVPFLLENPRMHRPGDQMVIGEGYRSFAQFTFVRARGFPHRRRGTDQHYVIFDRLSQDLERSVIVWAQHVCHESIQKRCGGIVKRYGLDVGEIGASVI